jgi:hypothetical protein
MNYSKLLDQAGTMANKAKDGKLKIDDVTYTLTFNLVEWIYEITDQHGEPVVRFNTKRLPIAKQWLREHLAG